MKRLFVKGTLDEAIAKVHEAVRAGTISFEGGKFPKAALDIFRQHGVAQPHKPSASAPKTEARRMYTSDDRHNVRVYGGDGGFDYGKKVLTQPCDLCGKAVEVPGTSVWWGKGKWERKLDGCRDDYPYCLQAQSNHGE